MSNGPCGCECPAIDRVPVHTTVPDGLVFDLGVAPQPSFPLPSLTLVLLTAALTLPHQKRRYVPPTLREMPAESQATSKWKLRLSPAERRFFVLARAALDHSSVNKQAVGHCLLAD